MNVSIAPSHYVGGLGWPLVGDETLINEKEVEDVKADEANLNSIGR